VRICNTHSRMFKRRIKGRVRKKLRWIVKEKLGGKKVRKRD